MKGYILGIDPGWSGGAALLDRAADVALVVSFSTMTEADIVRTIKSMSRSGTICFLERVHSMPAQGVASSFKFGMIYGLLRGLVIGKCRMIDVTPQKWQTTLGCLTQGDKNISKAKAQQLFPGVKVTHGNADALCIAYYGHLQERGNESR